MSACARLLLLAALPALAGRQWGAEGEVVSAGAGAGGGGPQFAARQRTAVVVAAGQPVALACRLLRLQDKTVSWVRSRDLQIVCHADVSFTADARVSCEASGKGELHALRVARARLADSGLYECQVNTEPKMSLFFNLSVVDEPVPAVVVEAEGAGAVRGPAGGSATLACSARYSPAPRLLPAAPLHVEWSRGVAGVDGAGGAQAVRVRGARGGVSLESEAVGGCVTSRLTLTELRPDDAGPYTCAAGDVSATLTLRVLEDDDHIDDVEPLEAMQRDEAHAHSGATGARSLVLLLLLLVTLASRYALGRNDSPFMKHIQ